MFLPATSQLAAAWIRERVQTQKPFYIRGAGTRLPPEKYLAAEGIGTTAMADLRFFHPEDMVIGVEAGMPFQRMQAILAEAGMGLPLSSWFAQSTIGGMVAANEFGPERLMTGGLRDSIIGIEYINPSGLLVKAGGKVVKNVTGYDLSRMMIGSSGGLGLITALNFKVTPLRQGPRILRYTSQDLEWVDGIRQLLTNKVPLDSLQASYQNGTWDIDFGFSGNPARSAGIAGDLAAHFAPLTELAADRITENQPVIGPQVLALLGEGHTHIHGSAPTGVLLDSARLRALAGRSQILICHPVGGDFHLLKTRPDSGLPALFTELFSGCEGHLTAIKMGHNYSGPMIFPKPESWGLVTRLQSSLDPGRLMRPVFADIC